MNRITETMLMEIPMRYHKDIERYISQFKANSEYDELGYRILQPVNPTIITDDDLDDLEDMNEYPWFLTYKAL